MTGRHVRVLLAVAVAGVLCASCGAARPSTRVVSYSAEDSVTGRTATLDELRGQPVLLSSWATWCAPCRTELPAIEQLHAARRGQGLEVVIVNIDSSDSDEAVIADLVDELGLTMSQWRDRQDAFTTTFRGLGVPMSVLIDRDGHLVQTWHGPLDVEAAEVQRQIDEVLAAD